MHAIYIYLVNLDSLYNPPTFDSIVRSKDLSSSFLNFSAIL
jgi:hypothetical protein